MTDKEIGELYNKRGLIQTIHTTKYYNGTGNKKVFDGFFKRTRPSLFGGILNDGYGCLWIASVYIFCLAFRDRRQDIMGVAPMGF